MEQYSFVVFLVPRCSVIGFLLYPSGSEVELNIQGLWNCIISEKDEKKQHVDVACFAWEDAKFCHTSQHEAWGFFNKKGKHQF